MSQILVPDYGHTSSAPVLFSAGAVVLPPRLPPLCSAHACAQPSWLASAPLQPPGPPSPSCSSLHSSARRASRASSAPGTSAPVCRRDDRPRLQRLRAPGRLEPGRARPPRVPAQAPIRSLHRAASANRPAPGRLRSCLGHLRSDRTAPHAPPSAPKPAPRAPAACRLPPLGRPSACRLQRARPPASSRHSAGPPPSGSNAPGRLPAPATRPAFRLPAPAQPAAYRLRASPPTPPPDRCGRLPVKKGEVWSNWRKRKEREGPTAHSLKKGGPVACVESD
ncbi:hypothetical protein VPH35_097397 [Triticum aestivum]